MPANRVPARQRKVLGPRPRMGGPKCNDIKGNRFPTHYKLHLRTTLPTSLEMGSWSRKEAMAGGGNTRRVGIADVASMAGVSHATVSRVMNGNTTVDGVIAARVRAPAPELK